MELTDQVRRYLLVYDTIKKKGPVTLKELTREVESRSSLFERCDVAKSRSTMLRITKALKADVGLISSKRGYELTADELEDDWLLDSAELLETPRSVNRTNEFVLREHQPIKGTEHIRSLLRAVKFSLKVSFDYRKYGQPRGARRIVEPYALKEYHDKWYLLAKEVGGRLEEAGEIKTWGLDRISNLSVSGDKFRREEDPGIHREFEHCIGIYSDKDKPVEEVILSFSPVGGRHCMASPLHASQEVLAANDREIRIRLRVRVTYDLLTELLARTQDVTVLAPDHLKERMQTIYRQALQRLDTDSATDCK